MPQHFEGVEEAETPNVETTVRRRQGDLQETSFWSLGIGLATMSLCGHRLASSEEVGNRRKVCGRRVDPATYLTVQVIHLCQSTTSLMYVRLNYEKRRDYPSTP
jgi:hypothetical protein